jgi:hypothetical protein
MASLPGYISTLSYHAAAERLLGIIDDISFPNNTKRELFSLCVASPLLCQAPQRAQVVKTESFVMCLLVDDRGNVITGNTQGFLEVRNATGPMLMSTGYPLQCTVHKY